MNSKFKLSLAALTSIVVALVGGAYVGVWGGDTGNTTKSTIKTNITENKTSVSDQTSVSGIDTHQVKESHDKIEASNEADTNLVGTSVQQSEQESLSATQSVRTLDDNPFGLALNENVGDMDVEEGQNEVALMEQYIKDNNIVEKLNNQEIPQEDLQDYINLFSHLSDVRTQILKLNIAQAEQDIAQQKEELPILMQQYKDGTILSPEEKRNLQEQREKELSAIQQHKDEVLTKEDKILEDVKNGVYKGKS